MQGLIFFYLNDYTVGNVAIFVCRNWFKIGQRRVVLELMWRSDDGPLWKSRILARLGRVDQLSYYIDSGNHDILLSDKKFFNIPEKRAR